MKYLLISDCSKHHICGATTKQRYLIQELTHQNQEVLCLNPDLFWTIRFPNYFNFHLTPPTPYLYWQFSKKIQEFQPDYIHILTEGPLGCMGLLYCKIHGFPFTTMRCTRFETYFPTFSWFIQSYLNWFHNRGDVCITPSKKLSLIYPHKKTLCIPNGCDTTLFHPEGPHFPIPSIYQRPYWLYVGRVAHEKNIDSLVDLSTKLPGTLIIVGEGPYQIPKSSTIYELGVRKGTELASIYRTCDVFVFPSKTDTFGQVMVEAMASGLPVAAYPVIGPLDVVKHGYTGYLNFDLEHACRKSLDCCQIKNCIHHANTFSWKRMCTQFRNCQIKIH